MNDKKETTIKILVVGNSGVGKTSLCNRYINERFVRAYKPTVGVEFCSKEFESEKNNKFNFQFWDIGGQERYIYMTHVYYKNSDFCLIMFDLMNRESFQACAKWKTDLDEKYRLADGSKCPCLLIGNKCDMSNRVLEQSEIEDFCREYEFYGYMEMSVKKNIMVKETIEYISNAIMKKKENEQESSKYDFYLRQEAFNLKTSTLYDTKKIGCLSVVKTTSCCNT
ncbi:ras-related Rab-7L1-like [Brachionus plicatilis]|uniref:Ras-related Rab-7L1-like n=1 Tax=Brachionus plicatilis TaxID=10195 RepID=A0A3M7PGT5_BRAPC|nr:ras-related Rab-7L1-like [Brachionus plicatilis]